MEFLERDLGPDEILVRRGIADARNTDGRKDSDFFNLGLVNQICHLTDLGVVGLALRYLYNES